jgi:hypothetical protein
MNDRDFFEALGKQWQEDTGTLDVSRRKAVRQQWRNRIALGLEIAIVLFAFWAVWFFWQYDATVYRVSALVLTGGALFSLWVTLKERIPLWHWHDWSPEGVLAYRVKLCESALRVVYYIRIGTVILTLFLVYIWVNALLDPASVPRFFPLFYTVLVMSAVLGQLWWAQREQRRKTAELRKLRTLLDSFGTQE